MSPNEDRFLDCKLDGSTIGGWAPRREWSETVSLGRRIEPDECVLHQRCRKYQSGSSGASIRRRHDNPSRLPWKTRSGSKLWKPFCVWVAAPNPTFDRDARETPFGTFETTS